MALSSLYWYKYIWQKCRLINKTQQILIPLVLQIVSSQVFLKMKNGSEIGVSVIVYSLVYFTLNVI